MTGAEDPLSEEKVKPSIFLICPDIDPIDPNGEINNCEGVRKAIEGADEINLWYGPSRKLRFQMGIALVSIVANPKKKITLVNKKDNFVRPIPSECFGFDINREVVFHSDSYQTLETYRNMEVVRLRLDLSEQSPFNFGIAFGLRKPILITNPQEIRPANDNDFNSVLLALDPTSKRK
jgi:hypothetical protein